MEPRYLDVSEYLTQKNIFKLKTLAELTAEVIASKTARTKDRELRELEVGFIEVFPGENRYRLK